MRADARERLSAAIEQRNVERGRPLTAREKLANLRRWLASCDTLPKGQDAKQGLAGTESGAVPPVEVADAQGNRHEK